MSQFIQTCIRLFYVGSSVLLGLYFGFFAFFILDGFMAPPMSPRDGFNIPFEMRVQQMNFEAWLLETFGYFIIPLTLAALLGRLAWQVTGELASDSDLNSIVDGQ